jgi:hypothetical protein
MREIRVIMAGCPDRFLERVILPCEAEDVLDVRERSQPGLRAAVPGENPRRSAIDRPSSTW